MLSSMSVSPFTLAFPLSYLGLVRSALQVGGLLGTALCVALVLPAGLAQDDKAEGAHDHSNSFTNRKVR